MSWDRQFDRPILLLSGRKLRTLREAGDYITSLPETETCRPLWQDAMLILIEVAEGRKPVISAQIAMSRALRGSTPHHGPGEVIDFEPSRWRHRLASHQSRPQGR